MCAGVCCTSSFTLLTRWFWWLSKLLFFHLKTGDPKKRAHLIKFNWIIRKANEDISLETNQEAEQSLRFYRNVPPNNSEDKSFEHELSKLKQLQQQHQQQEKNAENAKAASLKIADFMNRPFSICCILMAAHEMNGAFTMISYTGVIFAKSGSALSPAVSSIIVGAIQLLGAYVSTLVIILCSVKITIPSYSWACFYFAFFFLWNHTAGRASGKKGKIIWISYQR